MNALLHSRLELLRARLAAQNSALLAIGPGAHMDYLLGFHPHPDERLCLLLISAQLAVVVCPALSAGEFNAHGDIPLYSWTDDTGPTAALSRALETLGVTQCTQIAIDETLRADCALLLLDQLPHAKPVFTQDNVGWMRAHKTADEYQRLKSSALLGDSAIHAIAKQIRCGMSEREVTTLVNEHFSAHGASTEFAIVASGANSAFPHHNPGDTKLQRGDAILIDIGCRANGYPSDMTRMLAIGAAPEGYAEIHAIVEQAVQAALEQCKPGVQAKTVDQAAREVITAAGYGEYFTHRTGHGLGLDIHEPPYITATSDTVLAEGMVFSIEPGIYLPGKFGIRLEDIVILRADGPEILSELPRDLRIVDA